MIIIIINIFKKIKKNFDFEINEAKLRKMWKLLRKFKFIWKLSKLKIIKIKPY